jgi:hypothetical protein
LGKCLLSLTKYGQICRVYWNNELSFSSVTLWCKTFKSSVDSVKDAPHARRPKTATSPKMVEKVNCVIAIDAKFTTRYIAKCFGISVGADHTILRRDLNIRMDAQSLYKGAKPCSGKNLQTTVETVP